MSFATDFEIGFSTKQALRDKRKLEKALDALGRKAEQTGKRMDRALGRGVAQSTRNLKGVSKSIDKASQSAKRMERNLRSVTNESRKLAIQQRAVTASTRTAAAQAIAMGGGRVAGGAAGGAAGAAAATKVQGQAAAKAAVQNRMLAGSFAGVSAGAVAARSALMPLTLAVAALAGGAGLGAAVKGAITFADEIGKTASKLGVTTDTLQTFVFAAGQSGVNATTATMALQRFTRRAAEAAKGTGEAQEALKTMNIQLTDNQGRLRDSEDLLGDVAEAMKNTESAGERLRLGFKLFDSEGVALVNMLKDGRGAFMALTKQAHDMGIVLEKDLIINAEKTANEFKIASEVIKLEFARALVNAAPFILSVSEHIGFLAAGVRRLVDQFRALDAQSLRTIKENIGGLDAQIEALVLNAKKLEELRDKGERVARDPKVSARRRRFGTPIGGFTIQKQIDGINKALTEAIAKKKELEAAISRRTPDVLIPSVDTSAKPPAIDATAVEAEASRIEALVARLTRERIAAERSLTTVTLAEAQKRRAAIAFQFVDAIEEAKGNAEAIAAAQNAFVTKTAALNAELANKTIKTEKTLTDEILAMLNERAKATEAFGEIQSEVTKLIDDGTLSTEQGARALNQYADSLGLIDEKAKAATERLEGMGKALTNDVLGKVSEALVDFDFTTLTDSLFAANRQLLVGFVQESLRPVLGQAFEGLAEAAGPTTAMGKVFTGAAEEAFGGTGATVGEDLIIAAIEEQTRVIKGESPTASGARRVSSGGGRVLGGGPGISGTLPNGLTVNCVCKCECCCCDGGGAGQGSSRRGISEAASEAMEQDAFLGERREAQIDKVDNTVWDSAERTQRKIADLTQESRFGFSNMIQKSSQLLSDLPDLFGNLATAIVLGLTPKGPSTTDKWLSGIKAVADTYNRYSSGGGGAAGGGGPEGGGVWTIETGRARSGGVVGRSRFPTSSVSASVFSGAPRFQSGGVVPVLAHSGELITPLEGGRLPVIMNNGVPEVRTPGGDRVPVDIRGERDVGPVIFGAGAIVVMASPGERLDQTVGQAVEKAFVAGARQQRRNQGRSA